MKTLTRLFQFALAVIASLHLTSSYAVKNTAVIADPAYAHVQNLVDIDHGRRLNLYCLGSGSPAVIFDAGLGNWSQIWGLVQGAIAKRTQACAYDRAGLGFSDPATRDSSSSNIVDDLHRLLVAASVKPPYVLVGHSYGGMSMRLFADIYFNETAGMVLVDPTARDLAPSRDSLPLITAVEMAREDGVTGGLAQTCISAAETGFVKGSTVYKECVSEDINPRYSEDINAVYLRLQQTPNFWRAWQSEKIAIDTSSADELRTSRRDFGSLPLVVLTQSDGIGSDPKASRWVKAHDEIASLSTIGVNRIVPDSSHMIMLDQPQAVIDAIDDVLDHPTGGAIAGALSLVESLRAKFPHGIPWRVEILGADGKNLGSLEMLITSDQASSCLGEMNGGVRVNFTRKETLSPTISVSSYGVAKFTGDKIKIDLTGGICDAYLLMSGEVASDGSSTGEIYTLSMRGGRDVATYHATVR